MGKRAREKEARLWMLDMEKDIKAPFYFTSSGERCPETSPGVGDTVE